MNKLRLVLLVCLILVIVSVAFLPLLKNGFVNWDDDRYVTENVMIKNLSFSGIQNVFFSFHESNYHPLSLLSYMIEYFFFNYNPLVYHLTNLLLHLCNALLVFWIILLLSSNISVSFLTAIIFGIHPIHVESVAWISERRDVLYTLFFLGSLVCYLYYKRGRGMKYYLLSIVLFILSLLSKAMAVVLPFILLLLDYFLNSSFNKKELAKKIPFLAVSSIFLVITCLARHAAGDIQVQNKMAFLLDGLHNTIFSIVFYITKLILPVKLSILYPEYNTFHFLFLVSPFIIVIFLILIFFSAKYTKKIIFGSSFFLICLLPVLLVPSRSSWGPNDRYVYVASIGLLYIVSECFIWALRKINTVCVHNVRFLRSVIFGISIIVIGILAVLTWDRCKVWKDSITLWNDVLNNYPLVATAYNSRGAEYLARKEYTKAYADFVKTLSIDQNYYEAYFNLGSLYSIKGNYNEAIKLINKTLQINPGYLKAYDLLADIYGLTGHHLEVIDICKKAIRIKNDDVQAYINLCSAYGNLGNFQEAILYGEKAIAIDSQSALAHMNLSAAYFYAKQYDLAIKHCDMAIALGYEICPKFLEELKKASRHQN